MGIAAGVETLMHLHTSEKLVQKIFDMSVTEGLSRPDNLVQIGCAEISFERN